MSSSENTLHLPWHEGSIRLKRWQLRGCWCVRQPLRSQIFLPTSIYFCVLLSPLMCDLLPKNGIQQKIMSFWNLVIKNMAFILFAPLYISFSLIPSSILSFPPSSRSPPPPSLSLSFSLCISVSPFSPSPEEAQMSRNCCLWSAQSEVGNRAPSPHQDLGWSQSLLRHPDVNLMGDCKPLIRPSHPQFPTDGYMR